jgi:hypothetical protein
MVIVKDKSYLITTRIEIGHHFGREKGEAYVKLSEPNNADLFRLKGASGNELEMLAAFSEILPRVIVEHNIYKPGTPVEVLRSPEEVRDLIIERLGIYVDVVSKYCEEVVFILGSKSAPRSDGSPDSSTVTK